MTAIVSAFVWDERLNWERWQKNHSKSLSSSTVVLVVSSISCILASCYSILGGILIGGALFVSCGEEARLRMKKMPRNDDSPAEKCPDIGKNDYFPVLVVIN